MSHVFDQSYTVQSADLDVLGHVNNVVYVEWMQQIALAHCEHLGLGLQQYLELKHAMVAVEHHVQYRKAALEHDVLVLRTWIDDLNALYVSRRYAFYRPRDQQVVFVAHTQWACVEIATGRPKRLSPSFSQAYQPIDAGLNPYDFEKN